MKQQIKFTEHQKREAKYNKSTLKVYQEELKAQKEYFRFLKKIMEEYGINPKKLREENKKKGISGKITSEENLFLKFKKNPFLFENRQT